MRGPTPEICRRDVMLVGRARTIAFMTESLKTMKAGLPVFAASDFRQARRLASRFFCSGVYAAVVCSRSVLREALEGFAPAELRGFLRADEADVFAEMSLRRRSGGRGPAKLRPSWV